MSDDFKPTRIQRFLPLGILAVGLGLTLLAFYLEHRSLSEGYRAAFEKQVEAIEGHIRERLETYEDAMNAGRGLFAASNLVSAEEWASFYEAMNVNRRYPGIHVFGFLEMDAKQRHRVKFSEPSKGKEGLIGLDLRSDPIIVRTLERARSSGLTQMTGRGVLPLDSSQSAAFNLYMPLYSKKAAVLENAEQRQAAYLGAISAGFKVEEFIGGILSPDAPQVAFRIQVRADSGSLEELYKGPSFADRPRKRQEIQTERIMYGRNWVISWQAPQVNPALEKPALAVLLIGILLSAMIMRLAQNLLSTQNRALQIAQRMTTKLRDLYAFQNAILSMRMQLMEVLARFNTLDEAAGPALRILGRGIGAHRVLLWDLRDHEAQVYPGFTWVREGTLDRLSSEERFLDSLHGKEQAFWKETGPSASLLVPIIWDRELVACCVFEGLSPKKVHPGMQENLNELALLIAQFIKRIQAKAALQESEERFKAFMANSPVGATIKDARGKLLFANHQAQNVWDLNAEAVVIALDPVEQDVIQSGKARQFTATSQVGESTPSFWMHIKFPLKDPSGRPLVGAIALDISEQKKIESEIERARAAAEVANRAKSDFLGRMSHEIRTPLNGILGMTDVLLKTNLQVEQRDYLTMAKASADSLLGIINDILDFSRIDAKKLHLESRPFPLEELLNTVLKPLGRKAQEKDLRLVCILDATVPCQLIGDPLRLGQILINLVGNAIKFTQVGDVTVHVSCLSSSDGEACLRFAVKDTGMGIPQEKLESIFEAFRQGDGSSTRTFGGSGLGLTISSQLVQLMNGQLRVESQSHKGSSFVFDLHFPLQDVKQTAFGLPEERLEKRVLLQVRHLPTLAAIRVLETWQAKITVLQDVRQVAGVLDRARAEASPFDACILDTGDDDALTFALVRALKARPEYRDLHCVLILAGIRATEADFCKSFPMLSMLIKPVLPKNLFDLFLGDEAPKPNPAQQLQVVPERSLKVLVAEDNSINQTLVIRLLERRRCQVTLAKNGKEAVEAYLEQDFDMILMDIQMPLMSGMDAALRIRQIEEGKGRHMPIVAMTAHAMPGDKEKYLAGGMDDFISKPIKVDELFAIIDRITSGPEDRMSPISRQPLMDKEKLKSDLDNDWDLICEISSIFLDSAPENIEQLKWAIHEKDASRIEHQAHKLKGSIAIFGGGEATVLAQSIEEMGESKHIQDAEESFLRLQALTLRLIDELKEFLSQKTAA